MKLDKVRLLIFNQTEDYREAITLGRLTPNRLHAVEAMTTWGFQVQEVGVLGYQSNRPYNEVLDTGLRVIGSGMPPEANPEDVLKLAADFCPTHMVVQIPQIDIFRWAARRQIACIAMFQQSFSALTLQQRWQQYQFSKVLNHSQVDWIGNHGLQSCLSLQHIGVNPEKLVPWGWPTPRQEKTFEPKQLRAQLNPLDLVYVGPVISTKGVGDLLVAMAQLQSHKIDVRLKIIGQGDTKRFQSQARRLQLANQIEFVDDTLNNATLPLIRNADILVIPSRHEYPETTVELIYSGLSVHTPIVASDHPMFAGSLVHGVNAMIFPAGNARALAQRIERLIKQPRLYAKLSEATHRSHRTTVLPVTWASLIEHWLQQGSEDHRWLQNHTVASDKYRQKAMRLDHPNQDNAIKPIRRSA